MRLHLLQLRVPVLSINKGLKASAQVYGMRAGLHLEVRSVGIAPHANSFQDSLESAAREERSSNSLKNPQIGALKLILSGKRRFAEIACVPWAEFARRADFARRFWVRQSHIKQESRTHPDVAELEFVHKESQWLLIGATDLQHRIFSGELYDSDVRVAGKLYGLSATRRRY